MAEALGTVGFRVLGDAHLRNGTSLLEEVPDDVFGCAEAQVPAEDSRRRGVLSGSLGCGLVTGELNLERLSFEVSSVCLSLCFGRLGRGAILDEGNLLAKEILALGEGAELTEELAESFLSHLPADIAHEELGLAFVLGVHLLWLLLLMLLPGGSLVRF